MRMRRRDDRRFCFGVIGGSGFFLLGSQDVRLARTAQNKTAKTPSCFGSKVEFDCDGNLSQDFLNQEFPLLELLLLQNCIR